MNFKNALNMVKHTRWTGGGTFIDGANIDHTLHGCFVVGGLKPSLVVESNQSDEVIAQAIVDFAEDHAMVGTWEHTGKIYIDIVDAHKNRKAAIQAGRKRGEIAIFDFDSGQEIFL